MTRQINRLSPRFVASHKSPGYHADGGNLFLQIGQSGSKSWIFRYRYKGRRRDMGLGPLRDVSLKQARGPMPTDGSHPLASDHGRAAAPKAQQN